MSGTGDEIVLQDDVSKPQSVREYDDDIPLTRRSRFPRRFGIHSMAPNGCNWSNPDVDTN
jgi:hypothetical protein